MIYDIIQVYISYIDKSEKELPDNKHKIELYKRLVNRLLSF